MSDRSGPAVPAFGRAARVRAMGTHLAVGVVEVLVKLEEILAPTTCGGRAVLCALLVAATTTSGPARADTPSEPPPAAALEPTDENEDGKALRAAAAVTGIGAVALLVGVVTCVGVPFAAAALVQDGASWGALAAPAVATLVTAGGYALADGTGDAIHPRADDPTPDTTRRFAQGALVAAPSFFIGIPVGVVAGCGTGAALGVPVLTSELICLPTVTDAGYVAAAIGGVAGALVTGALAALVIPGLAEESVRNFELPFRRREGEPPPAERPSSPLRTMRW